MKSLTASNHPETAIKTQMFKVSELRLIPPEQWVIDRMEDYGYNESFENVGMLFPIIVSTHNPVWVQTRLKGKCPHHFDEENKIIEGYYVHAGNKRVLWAKKNGYDEIEGYLCDDQVDKVTLKSLMHIDHKEITR